MTTDKLALYNVACLALGDQRLGALTDDRPIRYDLDELYDRGKGLINWAMEKGYWKWAVRAIKIDPSTSVEPAFGFSEAYQIPTDFVQLDMISSSETFSRPLDVYEFEGDYIYTNVVPLYLRYTSDDGSWGADLTKWPVTFLEWLGTYMALKVCPRTKSEAFVEDLRKTERRLFYATRSADARNKPPRWAPLSTWASSRLGRSSRRDRGSRGALVGN